MDLHLAQVRAAALRKGRADRVCPGRRPAVQQHARRVRAQGRHDPRCADRRRERHRRRPHRGLLRRGGRHRQYREPHRRGGRERRHRPRLQRRRPLHHQRIRRSQHQRGGRASFRHRDASQARPEAGSDLDRHQQRHRLHDAGLSGDDGSEVPLQQQLRSLREQQGRYVGALKQRHLRDAGRGIDRQWRNQPRLLQHRQRPALHHHGQFLQRADRGGRPVHRRDHRHLQGQHRATL